LDTSAAKDRLMKSVFGWIIGVIMVVLLIAIIFVMGFSVGKQFQAPVSLAADSLSAWVSALATVCIAVLTILLAKETWALRVIQLAQIEQIRKDAIRPGINLYLKQTAVAFNFIDLHVANSGPGVALNVTFSFTNGSPETQDVYDFLQEKFQELAILRNGISSLGAGEHRTSYLFSFVELHEKFKDRALEHVAEVDIKYQDVEGNLYHSKAHLNFTEYKGISELGGGDPLYKISSTLEKMQKEIGNLTSGYRKLKTDVYTSRDRAKEREELLKQREEASQQRSNDS
jgi:hypothetical protein